MKFQINKKGKIKCPTCKKWRDLERDHLGGPYHEFTCCKRSFLISIDIENLKLFKEGKKTNPPPRNWWIRNQHKEKNKKNETNNCDEKRHKHIKR